MSSRRGGGKHFVSGTNNNPSSKGRNVSEYTNPKVEQLSHGVADMSLDSAQDDDGQWEQYTRKSKNRAGSSAAKPWAAQNSDSKAWGHQDVIQKLGLRNNGGSGSTPGYSWPAQTSDPKKSGGRGYSRPQSSNRGFEKNYVPAQSTISPPLEDGWNWQARPGSIQSKGSEVGQGKEDSHSHDDVQVDKENNADGNGNGGDDEDDDDVSDAMDDTDDDLLSDDFDSDASQKSHETRKKSRWFKKFFDSLDSLTEEEINKPARQWHCPACQGGPGSIEWYRGLQPLMTHAKTKGSKRVKLHRELAELLFEELHRRGTLVIPAGEVYGKWKGLKDEEKDHEIVWPPMVVIRNTKLEQGEDDKWIGMGNQELLDYFSSYAAVKAQHSYGPQGHRGMGVLIFESSAKGYIEAERLHKNFSDQGTDRNAWDHHGRLFYHGGKRQLYGYMAVKEDLDIFNQHSQGKSKLKFEMRSYKEMVTNQIRQMSEDNQQLIWLKNRVVKEQRHSKALEESFDIVSEKLRKTMEENRIVRQRTKMQHEQNKEEMDYLEQFYKDEIKIINEATDAKEENFEKLHQQEREKVKHTNANSSNNEEYRQRVEEKIAKFIQQQDKEIEDFVAERDKLIKVHEDKLAIMKRRHWEEEVEMQKELDGELTKLMEKYSPHRLEDASNSVCKDG